MLIILGLLGLVFPRLIILLLYFLTDWFQGVYDGSLLPILGFLFMPVTLFAYSVCYKFTGLWSTTSIVIIAIAIIIDLGLWKNGSKRRR
jgi:hypothetical protein